MNSMPSDTPRHTMRAVSRRKISSRPHATTQFETKSVKTAALCSAVIV